MVFPLDDNFVLGDNFFFLADIFFFAEADKKKILTNKRSYSSNGNTYIPMICRFYAPPSFCLKIGEKNMGVLHKHYGKKYHDKKKISRVIFLVIPFRIF